MKTVFIRTCVKSLLLSILLLSFLQGFSQPDYIFKNSTLIAGTDRQIGASYRFPSVKPGVDGIITIMDIKKITLDDIDGGSGFVEAFQPVIGVPKKTNGYVEFQLDFVNAGTKTPRIMTEVPLTAIDIDGYTYPDEKVYEYDEFLTSPSYYIAYDFIGTSLTVSMQGSWVNVANKTAVDYPGVDTVQKDVMFTMVHASVSSITFRVGANNKSKTDVQRLRSVYFKKFNFPKVAILSQSPVINFNGKKDKNNVTLNWEFANGNNIKEYALQRSVSGGEFTTIATAILNNIDYQGGNQAYNYSDLASENKSYAYRLKITFMDGKDYHSQIVYFGENQAVADNKLEIFPSVIQSRASVQVNCERPVKTSIQIVDYSGRIVYQTAVQFSKGVNSFNLSIPDNLAKGNYILTIPINGTLLTKKIIIGYSSFN
jgi:hypothetical protein